MASSDNKFLYNFVQLEGNATECCSYKAHISVSLFIAIAVQSLAFTFCLSLSIYIYIYVYSLFSFSLSSLSFPSSSISLCLLLPFIDIYLYSHPFAWLPADRRAAERGGHQALRPHHPHRPPLRRRLCRDRLHDDNHPNVSWISVYFCQFKLNHHGIWKYLV